MNKESLDAVVQVVRRKDRIGIEFTSDLHERFVPRLTSSGFNAAGRMLRHVHALDAQRNLPFGTLFFGMTHPVVGHFAQTVMYVDGRYRLDDILVGRFFEARQDVDQGCRVFASRVRHQNAYGIDRGETEIFDARGRLAVGDHINRVRKQQREP